MNRKRYVLVIVIIALAVPLSIMRCTMIEIDPPVIHSLQAEKTRVFPSESAQITCNASATDGAELGYVWWASGGEIDGDGPTATWTAPASEGTYTVGVILTDSNGRGATDNVSIVVQANQAPAITSLVADPDRVSPGGSVSMVCDAEDPDGHPLSYQWSESGGNIEGSGSDVNWTAPDQLGIYNITVVVSDEYGGSATRTIQVSVTPEQPPHIESLTVTAKRGNLRERPSGYEVGYQREYSIRCNASHPDGSELRYEWQCDDGEIAAISEDGSTITWISPGTRTDLTITVIVSDIAGNTATASVELEVVPCWT